MKWTKEPPKISGWYWAILARGCDDDPALVWCISTEGGRRYYVTGAWERRADAFRAWSDSPIPLPDGEVPR